METSECCNYKRGNCKFGNKCKYQHTNLQFGCNRGSSCKSHFTIAQSLPQNEDFIVTKAVNCVTIENSRLEFQRNQSQTVGFLQIRHSFPVKLTEDVLCANCNSKMKESDAFYAMVNLKTHTLFCLEDSNCLKHRCVHVLHRTCAEICLFEEAFQCNFCKISAVNDNTTKKELLTNKQNSNPTTINNNNLAAPSTSYIRFASDIGGVIIAKSAPSENEADQQEDTMFSSNYLNSAQEKDAFDTLRQITSSIGSENVFLISKCGELVQQKTLEWLNHTKFYEKTNIPVSNVKFCKERSQKAAIIANLGVTHFVDDRLDVLSHIDPKCVCILFKPLPISQQRNWLYFSPHILSKTVSN